MKPLSQEDALRLYDLIRIAHSYVKDAYYHDPATKKNTEVLIAIRDLHAKLYDCEDVIIKQMET